MILPIIHMLHAKYPTSPYSLYFLQASIIIIIITTTTTATAPTPFPTVPSHHNSPSPRRCSFSTDSVSATIISNALLKCPSSVLSFADTTLIA